jgi:hypothetical protein
MDISTEPSLSLGSTSIDISEPEPEDLGFEDILELPSVGSSVAIQEIYCQYGNIILPNLVLAIII